jgi:hypothetical protein
MQDADRKDSRVSGNRAFEDLDFIGGRKKESP